METLTPTKNKLAERLISIVGKKTILILENSTILGEEISNIKALLSAFSIKHKVITEFTSSDLNNVSANNILMFETTGISKSFKQSINYLEMLPFSITIIEVSSSSFASARIERDAKEQHKLYHLNTSKGINKAVINLVL